RHADGGTMPEPCLPAYVRLEAALAQFIDVVDTEAAEHITPLHQHIAMRLVIEGGFSPDEVVPHPPLVVQRKGKTHRLVFNAGAQLTNEQTVLGGLKSKKIDVVVTKPGVG